MILGEYQRSSKYDPGILDGVPGFSHLDESCRLPIYKVHMGVCKIFLYYTGVPIAGGGASGRAISVSHEETWKGAR